MSSRDYRDAPASAEYQHVPLRSAQSIRLLRLQPSQDAASPLQCELREETVEPQRQDKTKYDALSYVWGQRGGSHHILCNNQRIEITANCEAALKELRVSSKSRWLWVDAICIDQTKSEQAVEERNIQVQRMGAVYQSAQRVLIWLNDESPAGKMASKYFGRFHQASKMSFLKGPIQAILLLKLHFSDSQ